MLENLTGLNVSRETLDQLICFHDILMKWTQKINLISKNSASDVWNRHIWDSAQVREIAVDGNDWVDIGSGGGFPGIVIAIFAKEQGPARNMTLVESDARKSAFLRTVIRELELPAKVVTTRVENLPPQNADVISARALADLPTLMDYAERHLASSGKAIFFKGATWEKEVAEARKSWSFDLLAHKSKTNPNAAIIEVKEIHRV